MQTKRHKQEKALNNLLAQLENERETRMRLQAQVYYLITPNNTEFRLTMEVNALKCKLGLNCQVSESPF